MRDRENEERANETGSTESSGDRGRFEAFHRANPEVWRRFESGCLDMIASGCTNFGAPVVWERMRWESSAGSKSGSFRLPNEHRPHYARMFQSEHPDLAFHIVTRPLKSERYGEPEHPDEDADPEGEPSVEGEGLNLPGSRYLIP